MFRLSLCAGFLLSIIGSSCGKGTEPSTPVFPVSLSIQLDEQAYRPLLEPASILIKTSPSRASERLGYGGLVLVHSLTQGTYYAYDASCPYENRSDIHLQASEALELHCPSCGSRFEALGGTGVALAGPSRSPLRKYRAQLAGKRLSISN